MAEQSKSIVDGTERYNPLKYIRSDEDVESFITCLMKNTTGDKEHKGDPFWENAELNAISNSVDALFEQIGGLIDRLDVTEGERVELTARFKIAIGKRMQTAAKA